MLTFEIIRDAWSNLKAGSQHELRAAVPALSDPSAIFVKRVGEDDMSITVSFAGFESAVQASESVPLIKRAIMSWLKKITPEVRIVPGTNQILTVKLSKLPNDSGQMNPPEEKLPKYERRVGPDRLANIVKTRLVGE